MAGKLKRWEEGLERQGLLDANWEQHGLDQKIKKHSPTSSRLYICSRSVKLVCFYGFVYFSGNVLYAGHLVSQVIILIIITVIITRSYWKLLQLLLILTISQPIKTMILSYSEILWVSHSHGIVGIDFLCSMVFEVSARKTWLPGTQINWRCLHAHTGQPMLAIGWDLNWILDQAPPYGLSICLGFLRVIKLLPR